jgi:hypothetical protein
MPIDLVQNIKNIADLMQTVATNLSSDNLTEEQLRSACVQVDSLSVMLWIHHEAIHNK